MAQTPDEAAPQPAGAAGGDAALGGLTVPERQAYEARIVKLERGRASVAQLVRFQIEAYKTRIADLKRSLAHQRRENQALRRELGAAHRRHAVLRHRLQEIGRQLEQQLASPPEGEKR